MWLTSCRCWLLEVSAFLFGGPSTRHGGKIRSCEVSTGCQPQPIKPVFCDYAVMIVCSVHFCAKKHVSAPCTKGILQRMLTFEMATAASSLAGEAHPSFGHSCLHRPMAVSYCVLCRYVGLWQTNVLALNLAAPPRLQQEPVKPTINFLFGDDSSARTQVDVPYNQRSTEASGLMHAYRLQSRCCCWTAALLHMYKFLHNEIVYIDQAFSSSCGKLPTHWTCLAQPSP